VRRAIRRGVQRGGASTIPTAKTQDRVIVTFGEAWVNFASMEVKFSGKPVTLTAQEFKLLKFLVAAPGVVHSRETLLNAVWGYQVYPTSRTVDNHILRLRQKLERDPAEPQFFITMHGTGYKFVPQGDSHGDDDHQE
jgi:DNA-binding response OmpR family regulator